MITLPTFGDKHVHVRLNGSTRQYSLATARLCHNALVMPNDPAIMNEHDVRSYRESLVPHLPDCTPLMTMQLTPVTSPQHIKDAKERAGIVGVKMYTKGTTTASANGIDRDRLLNWTRGFQDNLGMIEKLGLVLEIHGMMPGEKRTRYYEAERDFIPVLTRIANSYPRMKIVLEHVSTAAGVAAVQSLNIGRQAMIAATITLQHLLNTIDDLVGDEHLGGMLNPHMHCWPPIQPEEQRLAVQGAATSGSPYFFFGSDSAPHSEDKKMADMEKKTGCCAGVFSAPVAVETLIEAFDEWGAMKLLPEFASYAGDAFYGLPRTTKTIRAEKKSWVVPNRIAGTVPYRAGHLITWSAERC